MSHYTRAKTRFTDSEVLLRALAAMGFPEAENHDQVVPLYGYRGDQRTDRANIVIRRVHIGAASNDIGFIRSKSGEFTAIISAFDTKTFNDDWIRLLSVEYAKASVDQFAHQGGWTTQGSPEIQEDGTIRLVLRRGA